MTKEPRSEPKSLDLEMDKRPIPPQENNGVIWQELLKDDGAKSFVKKMERSGSMRGSERRGLLWALSQEPETARKISAIPEGRALVLKFIKILFRSAGITNATSEGNKAIELFNMNLSDSEKASLRDAELDSIVNKICSYPIDYKHWAEGCSDEEIEVIVNRAIRKGLDLKTPITYLKSMADTLMPGYWDELISKDASIKKKVEKAQ